jgi:uncharacterized membrane protein (UPF0127 family)
VAEIRTVDGAVVCTHCAIASSPLARMKGLLGRSGLDSDEGLVFPGTGSIHMFFMRFAIDAVFCDRDLHVVKVVRNLKPWRMAAARGAKVVIELPVGGAAGLEAGDRLVLSD